MKTAINLRTQEEFNNCMELFRRQGLRGYGGQRPERELRCWNYYKEDTCVNYKNKFVYADRDFFEQRNFRIIDYHDFLELYLNLGNRR